MFPYVLLGNYFALFYYFIFLFFWFTEKDVFISDMVRALQR